MNSNLTSKLPVREHIKNIKKLLKTVHDMEKTYFPMVCLVHVINVIVPYTELVLSAYILDGVSQGRGIGELMPVIAAVTAVIFVLHCLTSRVWNRICKIKQDDMYYRYSCMIETKMLKIDYYALEWTLPTSIANNTMIWMVSMNGLTYDARKLPVKLQEKFYKEGKIPYVPAHKKLESQT